ncbi:MAG: hypothetical protein EXR65_01375 [Dehalococcoidia bacterium]|nr:hypothetical protein [Dehalococcoidia bacterium]
MFDSRIRDRQLAQLATQLRDINAIRATQSLAASTKESRMRAVGGVKLSVRSAAVLVAAGQALTASRNELLGALGLRSENAEPRKIAASALVAALAGAAAAGYLVVAAPRALAGMRRLTLFGLLLVVPVLAAKFAFPALLPDGGRHFLAYAVPLAVAPIAAAVLLDLTTALLLTMLLAAIAVFVPSTCPRSTPRRCSWRRRARGSRSAAPRSPGATWRCERSGCRATCSPGWAPRSRSPRRWCCSGCSPPSAAQPTCSGSRASRRQTGCCRR